jgi:hypothetical protein
VQLCPSVVVMTVVAWLSSSIGIRAEAVIALVCQLAGVVLVVKDIRDNSRRLVAIAGRFDEIDRTRAESTAPYTSLLDNLPSLEGKTHGEMTDDFRRVFAAPFMVGAYQDQAIADKVRALATLRDDQSSRSWIGAALLLLGIVFSFTATWFGVK